jgi:hypothetical protein
MISPTGRVSMNHVLLYLEQNMLRVVYLEILVHMLFEDFDFVLHDLQISYMVRVL